MIFGCKSPEDNCFFKSLKCTNEEIISKVVNVLFSLNDDSKITKNFLVPLFQELIKRLNLSELEAIYVLSKIIKIEEINGRDKPLMLVIADDKKVSIIGDGYSSGWIDIDKMEKCDEVMPPRVGITVLFSVNP